MSAINVRQNFGIVNASSERPQTFSSARCHISAKSWSSTFGIHYHRVLDCFPSTVKCADKGACKSLCFNGCQFVYFRTSNSGSTKCVSTMNCHANDRVSPAPLIRHRIPQRTCCLCESIFHHDGYTIRRHTQALPTKSIP
jgi:hypothetical protein